MYMRPDELHTAFNFNFVRAAWDADELRRHDRRVHGRATEAVGAPTTWVLSNHDVTRHATRYARLDRTGGGVADDERVRPDTPLDPELGLRRARAAALLLLGLPGSAYVYQGEELGLPEVVDLPEEVLADPIWERSGHRMRGRDGCRVPMPWEPARPVARLRRGRPVAAAAGRLGRPVGRGPAGRRRLDARALPQRAAAAPRAARTGGDLEWLRQRRRARWSSGGVTPAVRALRGQPRRRSRSTCRRTTGCCSPASPLDGDRPQRLPGDGAVWLGC